MSKVPWLLAFAVLFLGACSRGPTTYDDCILQYVKAGMDSAAVASVMRSCRAKFPDGQPAVDRAPERALALPELRQLTGRAGLSYGSYYFGSLYNGNEGLVVTRVEIEVTTTVSKEVQARTYRANVSIGPQSAGDFGFDIIVGDRGADYTWSIVRAWGRPAL